MKRGFSLIETVYASVLFAFVVLFICNLYPSSMVAVRRGDNQIVADNFAQSILEDLRSRSFTNVSTTNEPTYAKLVYADTEYTPVVDVFYHPDRNTEGLGENLKVANVKVRWTFQKRQQEVVHEMYLHNVTR